MKYEAIIGLEVHAHLKTKSKIFCGCSTEFGRPPNSNICPICVGHPGVLPVLNKKAVELILKAAIALNCKINKYSVFARKHYFYPDLPKNFQISQYELPIAYDGYLNISTENGEKKIRIKRIHLEEDAGKLLHAIGSKELDFSLVDYNRSGIPLMEIVTEPDINTPQEAWQYLNDLKAILEYLDVSDCNMEEGKLRCDANISLKPLGSSELGTKIELKNMNTTKGVRDALEYEIKRQSEILSNGGKIVQETRLYSASTNTTSPMRTKEETHDYRYFPEPDLPPLELSDEFIESIRKEIVELPKERKKRFVSDYGLSDYDAEVLTSERSLADYFEEGVKKLLNRTDKFGAFKLFANWTINEMLGRFNADGGKNFRTYNELISPTKLSEIVELILDGKISGKIAKVVFENATSSLRDKSINEIIEEKGLTQVTDEAVIKKLCEEALTENPDAAREYKAGKEKAIGSLIGAVMKKSSGKANPKLVNEILKKLLS